MINDVCTPLMLKNHGIGCRGNRAFFHSAIEFILSNKVSLHFLAPNK